MKVSRETFRMVRWLLIGLLALQLVIVPWRWFYIEARSGYAPIFTPPEPRQTATIDVGRLLLQLAVTGGLLLLWPRVAKPEE